MAKKVQAKAKAAKVKHERVAKPSETEMIEKGRKLAANYLVRRDGMEIEIAVMVVEGMEPEAVNELIAEANTAVIERTKGAAETVPPPAEEADDDGVVDFTQVPALAAHEEFVQLVTDCARDGRHKLATEKAYKAGKEKLFAILHKAGIELDDTVMCMEIKVTPYQGQSPPYLDKHLLLEAGVSIDIINRCWKSSKYNDVRITAPKDFA